MNVCDPHAPDDQSLAESAQRYDRSYQDSACKAISSLRRNKILNAGYLPTGNKCVRRTVPLVSDGHAGVEAFDQELALATISLNS